MTWRGLLPRLASVWTLERRYSGGEGGLCRDPCPSFVLGVWAWLGSADAVFDRYWNSIDSVASDKLPGRMKCWRSSHSQCAPGLGKCRSPDCSLIEECHCVSLYGFCPPCCTQWLSPPFLWLPHHLHCALAILMLHGGFIFACHTL